MIWLGLSSACMVAAALVHSVLGYRRLIVPLLRSGDGLLADALTRRILRFAWHATAVLMLVSAAAVSWPGAPKGLLAVIGAAWLATGSFNAIYTKGRHIAWPVLSAAGLFALIGGLS
ncbi:hypothetical protein CVO77_01690 [Sphingopyxis lindanitolerans]|uniref:DUF3325 domain-containing protein n=1 Tax=Sphingopyxis lindanitolerans TaxID=2054227 RepID=A0A2S8B4V6_9SPHN|nr:hypothetical protein [Sphingopyxis lindanitolerans]PQM27346.1 hypothetical protein CVO77_01690 [Sphingopyxis lindanitolerans]